MDIRRIGAGDEALWSRAVSAIVPADDRDDRLASTEELAETSRDSRCYLYLASLDGEPAGLLSAYRFPDSEGGGQLVYLYSIEVEPRSRQRGVGTALVRALVAQCSADGVRRIWAGTHVDNVAARRTFEATEAELEGDAYVEYEWEM